MCFLNRLNFFNSKIRSKCEISWKSGEIKYYLRWKLRNYEWTYKRIWKKNLGNECLKKLREKLKWKSVKNHREAVVIKKSFTTKDFK